MTNDDSQKAIVSRLHRIEGQVRGIEKMVVDDKDAKQIIIQIQAVISALDSVKSSMLKKQIKDELMKSFDAVVDLIK
jgi:DNA-binding FrmR family transcriptional regulator